MGAREKPYISKWVTFAASAFIQTSAGLSYSFSVYAPTIKDTLGLSQTQVATVGSCVNLGGYFAILSGSVYDNLKEHHQLGPRLVLWLGCLCCLCGYLGMWLMASGKAPNNFPQLLIFAIAAGNMGTWFDTTTLVTNVRNFPNDRGFVVGVLKSFLGLSSSVYTTIYVAVFEPDAVAFLLMLAIVPTVLGLLLSLGLNYVPFVEMSEGQQGSWSSTEGRFSTSFLLVGLLALYQMGSAVLMGHQELGTAAKATMVAGMALLLAAAAGLPLRCGSWRASYGHAYITTRESLADDDDDDCHRAVHDEQPGSPLPPEQWQEEGRGSQVLLHSHAAATAHHRAVGNSSGCSSSSRPGHPVHVVQTAAGPRSKSPSKAMGMARSSVSSGGSSNARSSGSRRDLLPLGRQLLSGAGDVDDAAEAAPLLPPGAPGAGIDSSKASAASPPSTAGGTRPALVVAGSSRSPPLQREQLHVGSLSTAEMLSTLDFWLLFSQFTVASGVCLAYLNNLGQLVVSLGGGHDGQVVFVSLFSVANAAGRLLLGYIPEQHLHARGTPRTMFLTVSAAVTAASCLSVAYANLTHLYIISILLGMAFGAHWSLLPAITSDLFGLKHFAANYTTLQFAPALGSYVLATRLTGYLYDRAAVEHGDPHQCIGPDCFREAFLLLSGMAALSSIACSVATSRSRRAYVAMALHLKQVEIAEGHSSNAGEGLAGAGQL